MKYEDFLKLVEMAKGTDGCAYTEVGAGLYLVMAWLENESGQGYTQEYNGKTYTLMGKIAYNCDDLQCDYDYDWYMPYAENGDVYDTSMAISKRSEGEDFAWVDYMDCEYDAPIMNAIEKEGGDYCAVCWKCCEELKKKGK